VGGSGARLPGRYAAVPGAEEKPYPISVLPSFEAAVVESPAAAPVLHKELASEHRVAFLTALSTKPMAAGQLAKRSGLSVQEAMRHLARLRALGLIEKRDRDYVTTPIGDLIVRTFPYYDALLADPDFFLTHDLRFLPQHLAWAPFLRAQRHRGLEADHMAEYDRHGWASEGWLRRAADQHFYNHVAGPRPPEAKALDEWGGVYGAATVTSPGFLALADDLARSGGRLRVRIRVAPTVPCMLSVNPREAMLFLRHRDGPMDFATLVHGTDPTFLAWARALFRHFEEQAVLAFDTERGDRWPDWAPRLLAAAEQAMKRP
jgi:predicted transcriptional regulator